MQNSALFFSVDKEGWKERLPLAMINNADVCDVGYLYVIFTYIFEGDHPLILSAYRGFEKLDAAAGVNSDGRHDFPVPTVDQIADKSISLLNDARGSVASKVKDVSALLLTVDNELVAKKDALADLFCNRSRAGHGSCVSSREVTRTAFTTGGQVTTTNTQERKIKAEDEVKKQNKVVDKAK